jgi:hypothetical protein
MDEQELLKKEKELELQQLDLSNQGLKIDQGLQATTMKQENLRRAIEVASNATNKLASLSGPSTEGIKELKDLISLATALLKEEIEKK